MRTSPEPPRVNLQSWILVEEPDQPIIELGLSPSPLPSSVLIHPSAVRLVDLLNRGTQSRGETRLRFVPLFPDAIDRL